MGSSGDEPGWWPEVGVLALVGGGFLLMLVPAAPTAGHVAGAVACGVALLMLAWMGNRCAARGARDDGRGWLWDTAGLLCWLATLTALAWCWATGQIE